ncbi:carbohydrate-binding protein [Cellulomonas fimi]|uniref:carbohydrate-binding protein n=1 Tax=Cellulomonas fimi TaxID=1708 RepID=UPI0020135F61|nr:carbohydrate-binding protein [Cellulomonas fimi]
MLDFGGPGVYLRQRDVSASSATVDVTTKLWNNNDDARTLAVRTVVTRPDGGVVVEQTSGTSTLAAGEGTEVVQIIAIARPRLWNGVADPYLYDANVEVIDRATGRVVDVVTEPLGLRTVAVDADEGFSLNGARLPLRGVNLHQDRAEIGWAQSNADHVEDFDIIGEMGANAVRMAHYQHDQKDYELADERGFVVYAELPFINDYTDTPAFEQNVRQQLTEMIRQNYNHPSIVFWGIGNEQRVDDARTNELLAGLSDLADAEDPDRITTYASCCLSDSSPVTEHAETSSYNKYFGWYGSPDRESFGQWADKLRAAEPDKAIGISEYGAGANTRQHALDPLKPETTGRWHPEEYQAQFHERVWKDIEARPFIWGSFVWNMFDFASDRRSEGDQPGINDKGLVTRDRQVRKDAYYFYKASWASTPTLHITSERWADRTDPLTDLKVYSNATSVSATLNGRPLGSRASGDKIFRWDDVTLDPGQNVVTVAATIGGVRRTDSVTWTLGTRPGLGKIQAETHDRQTGTEIQDTEDGGPGMNVGYVHEGDVLTYKGMDFGSRGPRAVVTRVASESAAGGVVEYRLDSPTGPVVASVPVTSTGGWQQWASVSAPVTEPVRGVRDVYVTFRGGGSGGIVNLNWFTFDD